MVKSSEIYEDSLIKYPKLFEKTDRKEGTKEI
jgi:hypothetical protein